MTTETQTENPHEVKILKVRTIIGASHAYAAITGENFSLDVQLKGGCSAATSMRQTAAELRQEAADRIKRAMRIEAAAMALEAASKIQ